MTFVDRMIDDIIRREGGYVDHPADRGGATNHGITQATLAEYMGRRVSKQEVKLLTKARARAIYASRYYRDPAINKLPDPIQPFVFDAAVNHGPSQAIKFLQQACNSLGHWGLTVDGRNGPLTQRTAALVWQACGERLLAKMVRLRREFYRGIVERDPGQGVFLAGWLNRVAEFEPDAPATEVA